MVDHWLKKWGMFYFSQNIKSYLSNPLNKLYFLTSANFCNVTKQLWKLFEKFKNLFFEKLNFPQKVIFSTWITWLMIEGGVTTSSINSAIPFSFAKNKNSIRRNTANWQVLIWVFLSLNTQEIYIISHGIITDRSIITKHLVWSMQFSSTICSLSTKYFYVFSQFW